MTIKQLYINKTIRPTKSQASEIQVSKITVQSNSVEKINRPMSTNSFEMAANQQTANPMPVNHYGRYPQRKTA